MTEELNDFIHKEYRDKGTMSAPYIMRKYKLSREEAEKQMEYLREIYVYSEGL